VGVVGGTKGDDVMVTVVFLFMGYREPYAVIAGLHHFTSQLGG
jgi:hypothetical protein